MEMNRANMNPKKANMRHFPAILTIVWWVNWVWKEDVVNLSLQQVFLHNCFHIFGIL